MMMVMIMTIIMIADGGPVEFTSFTSPACNPCGLGSSTIGTDGSSLSFEYPPGVRERLLPLRDFTWT
jgi:hypothetical protein